MGMCILALGRPDLRVAGTGKVEKWNLVIPLSGMDVLGE